MTNHPSLSVLPDAAPTTDHPPRPLKQFPQVLCAVLLAMYLGFFVVRAVFVLFYPYALEYGEGSIIYESSQLFRNGFAPASLYTSNEGPPYQASVYGPLFYYLHAFGMVFLGAGSVAAGRLVSVLACAYIGLALYRVARVPALAVKGRARIWLSLAAATTPFATIIVYGWGIIAKTDLLAVALSLAAVKLAWQAERKQNWSPQVFVLSAFVCALALLSKQSALAAPLAIGLWLVLGRQWKYLLIFGFTLAGSVLGIGLFFQLTTDGAFFQHLIIYNAKQPFLLQIVIERFPVFLSGHWVLIGLSLVLVLRPLVKQVNLWRIYFVTALLVSFSLGKIGSFDNYFIELIVIASLLAWWVVGWLSGSAVWLRLGRLNFRGASPVLVLMAVQLIQLLHIPFLAEGYYTRDYSQGPAIAAHVRFLAGQGPLLAEDSLWQASQNLPLEMDDPFIFAQLGGLGGWNSEPFLEKLRSGYYRNAFFEVCKVPGPAAEMDEAVEAGMFEPLPGRLAPQVWQILKDRTRFVPARRIGCMVFLSWKGF